MSDVVYILTNPVMDGLVKIGKTTQSIKDRVKQLSRDTGVPVPFEVHYACTVRNADEAEKLLHQLFDEQRINPKKEFFEISPEKVVLALKLAALEDVTDVTPSKDIVENDEEQKALDKARSRKPNIKLSSIGILPGAILHFTRDEKKTATIVDDDKIRFEGEVTSLSAAANALLMRDHGWRETAKASGSEYWMYEGEILSERRTRMENED